MAYTGSTFFQPTATTFTNLNIAGVTGAAATKVGDAITLYVPPKSGHNIVGQYVAAPATPYCTIANFVLSQGDWVSSSYTQEQMIYGIGFYDGTKLIMMAATFTGAVTMSLTINEYATVTSTPTTVFGSNISAGQPSSMVRSFQIQDDGTNIHFSMALDGNQGLHQPYQWVQLYIQARTSFLSAVTNVFFGVDSNGSNSGTYSYATLNSWQTVAL